MYCRLLLAFLQQRNTKIVTRNVRIAVPGMAKPRERARFFVQLSQSQDSWGRGEGEDGWGDVEVERG